VNNQTPPRQSADKQEGVPNSADHNNVKPLDTPQKLAPVRGVLRRKREMKDESPLTGLPGNNRVQEEIEERVTSGQDFALLLVDIDRFKAFNDHYGFPRGDTVIQELAKMMQDVIVGSGADDGFVGHLGGDDFIVVVGSSAAALVADTIVQRFDPISLSIGVASTQRRTFAHFAEVMAIASEMKNFTKTTPGSSWSIDRRG
jgi:diguanylate cyclase (GGDEF)-like protein